VAAGPVARPVSDEPPTTDEGSPSPHTTLASGAVFYGLLLLAGYAWLWGRGREGEVARLAIGDHGPWLGSGVGLAVGWLGAVAVARFGNRSRALRTVEQTTADLFRGVGDMALVSFLLFSAVAEELFFRLAVQDALGLAGSVAVYIVLNSCIGGLGMVPFAAVHALATGLLVQHGFGLLGSTTAHAIMNHLTLRRLLCT